VEHPYNQPVAVSEELCQPCVESAGLWKVESGVVTKVGSDLVHRLITPAVVKKLKVPFNSELNEVGSRYLCTRRSLPYSLKPKNEDSRDGPLAAARQLPLQHNLQTSCCNTILVHTVIKKWSNIPDVYIYKRSEP
jgi:hypothetical protein